MTKQSDEHKLKCRFKLNEAEMTVNCALEATQHRVKYLKTHCSKY